MPAKLVWAPDYILCPREQVDELIAELKTAFKKLIPKFAKQSRLQLDY